MRRRWSVAAAIALLALLPGCVNTTDPSASLYHRGELTIGTGNTTGVFYEIGAGYANVINRHLPGYEAMSAATAGSVENLQRLASGDVDLALTFSTNAVEALRGQGAFAGHPIPIRAIGRLYPVYTHLIVRTDAHINSVADLRGHRITTGPHNSGSELTALRILAAVGLTPGENVTNVAMSLPQSTAALAAGRIDAMFYTAGLPVPGITDLFTQAGAGVRLLPLDSVLPKLSDRVGAGVYFRATIPRGQYALPDDVPTIAESSLLVVTASMPVDLVYQLTRLLFTYQSELAAVHPAANSIQRDTAPTTAPVPLHPGAARYYDGG
ncbi:MAG TPA: TAXI family TRAP transporter solute-binding subunit [Rugosimonospora sp.]|nr:TAXI family TRAP transporter solute-binding subunit [Rugosimonospora sp.]